MDIFLETYNHLKLNQEDINHLNRSITKKELKLPSRASQRPGPDGFIAEFYETFKEN
jgi:hypothetical protein